MSRLDTSQFGRVRVVHDRPPSMTGQYVLYWMIGARRPSSNFALDRAVDWARELRKPLLVLEALRSDYRWASDRLHRFALDGMLDNLQAFSALGVGYYPYVERAHREGRGLLRAMAADAAVVVTDRMPTFELPAMTRAAAQHISVRFEAVDGNGTLPLDTPPSHAVYPTAYAFRRQLQRVLHEHLERPPRSPALRKGDLAAPTTVPDEICRRWPPADSRWLDQVVTWRELGFNMAARRPDCEQFESLPPWAIGTLAAHASDARPYTYTMDQSREASTHEPLWNAAQRQLLTEGRLHNYLRMLWGKKILEWTASPREALDVMVELNNRFALDGRDPNSYSGIFWVLGRYDRPWPERPIFGKVRYMTSESTARKLRLKAYLRRYGASLFWRLGCVTVAPLRMLEPRERVA